MYLVYLYKAQTSFQVNMFKEHIETTALKQNAYWVRTHGSEIKARGTDTAKKAEKVKKTESN